MIGALCALYDGRDDTVNVNRTLKMFQAEVEKSLKEKLDEAAVVSEKIYFIAKNILHHVSLKLDFDKVLDRAGLTPDGIKRLIEVSKETVNALSYANDRSTFADFRDTSKQTYRILDRLSER